MSYIRLAILRGGYARLVYEFSIGGVFHFFWLSVIYCVGEIMIVCVVVYLYIIWSLVRLDFIVMPGYDCITFNFGSICSCFYFCVA
jgi:hypothetical protein